MNATPDILSHLGTAALGYAARGWYVFPLQPGGKLPLISQRMGGRGHLDATTDLALIRRWWTATPDANIGLYLAPSGLVAVDPDIYKPECGWDRFIAGRAMPETLRQRTPRGGMHYIFAADPSDDFAGEVCPAVDIKHKGYIALAPSVFEGNPYVFENDADPAPCPDWVPRKGRAFRIDTGRSDQRPAELAEVAAMLEHIDPDAGGYSAWLNVLMALHEHTGGSAAGLALADDWSARGAKYRNGEVEDKWRGFKPGGGVRLATIAEMARRGGADLADMARRHRPASPAPQARSAPPDTPRIKSARDLQGRHFPPIKWVVPGLLPEGLTILMGAPKLGKSWLTLDIALAVARGGRALGQDCERGDVLLLALEDNERRLQDRLAKIAGEGDWPETLAYTTEWDRLNAGGLAALEAWIDQAPNPRLIVVDTLGMVKPQATGKGNAYDQDIAALRPLHQLASARRVSIVVVTHNRKMEADDPLEGISGTNGLTGTADTTIALLRTPAGDGCILYGRGRDLAEVERAVRLVDCRWQIDGEPLEAFAGETWKAIIKAVREGAHSPKAIAAASGLTEDNTSQALGRMVRKGVLTKTGRGAYMYPLSEVSGCQVGGGEPDTSDNPDTMRGGNTQ